MVTYDPQTVPLDQILLDPNNFRFKKPGPASEVAEKRFAEEKVQTQALDRIKADGVGEIKLSISENGFVPVERIVVRKVDTDDGEAQRFVAVEGNRRTAALKILQQEHAGGIDLPESVVEVFSDVPVLVALEPSADDLLAIMGIRHVGGPKEWGGYQAARLVHQLIRDNGLSAREVASRLGLTVHEVNRRNRAFSVLTQMTDDETFGDYVTPEMYPIFHEVVGQVAIRDWLGWDDRKYLLTNDANRELLYTWLAGNEENEPKITGYGDVRSLRQILENEDAFTALKDDDQSLVEALMIANADAKAKRWLPNVKAALASLDDMSIETIDGLDKDELEILSKLKARVRSVMRLHEVASEDADSDDED